MAKAALACNQCGYRSFQWVGRCPQCRAWESLEEAPKLRAVVSDAPVSIASVDLSPHKKFSTGVGELDRVLGGGLTGGSVVLLAGEPGVGKSTLMLQVAAGLEAGGREAILFCGEETHDQVAARAARLGGLRETKLSSLMDVDQVAELMSGADVAIIDSVQTLRDSQAPGEPGSVGQVRVCGSKLAQAAKASHTTVLLVGHVTKDGSVAGPRTLEHVVDVVLTFDGDRGHQLRTVRGVKNRFGPAGELGVFEMLGGGLKEVPDASKLFMSGRSKDVCGSAVGCVIEGRRPVALEVQALVVENKAYNPRRVAHGLELTRLGLAIAVLQSRAGVMLSNQDVYATVTAGLRATEPGIDLALSLAIASSVRNQIIPAGMAAVGEVGLGSELRQVPALQARVDELARLGFDAIIVPACAEKLTSSNLLRAATVKDAINMLGPVRLRS